MTSVIGVTTRRRAASALAPLIVLGIFWALLQVERRPGADVRNDDCLQSARDVAAMEACLATHQDDVTLMLALGAAYADGGHPARAEAAYKRALAVDPDDGGVHVRLGELLLARGDTAGAAREADAALRTLPGNGPATDLKARAAASGTR